MQTKKVNVCNKKTQNYFLSDIEPPLTNLMKDRQKYQVKYRHPITHIGIQTPKRK